MAAQRKIRFTTFSLGLANGEPFGRATRIRAMPASR